MQKHVVENNRIHCYVSTGCIVIISAHSTTGAECIEIMDIVDIVVRLATMFVGFIRHE
jgi:hypothetical protein